MDIELLNETRLREWCRRIRLPEESADALAGMAAMVRESDSLYPIFAAYHEKTAIRGEWHRVWEPLPMDPYIKETLGDQTPLFYLLAFLAALPYAEKTYQRMGISEEIFDATMQDINFYTCKAYDVHGHWTFDEFSWIWHHLSCELFRLGRLQFTLANFEGHVTAFKHRETGTIQLLCGSEIPLRLDGYAQGAGKWRDEPRDEVGKPENGTWFAAFKETETGWFGNPVLQSGQALRGPVFLSREKWECVLQKGDTILDLHIPRARDLSVEDCRDSFRQAFAFFPHYFPDRPFKAVYCHTWLFSPQLQQFLPPESNIVRFQREFYLYPHPGGPDFLWNFVFGPKYKDPATAPRNTSLRRIVLDWLESGKEIFDLPGLMFHGPDQWGIQPYWDKKY